MMKNILNILKRSLGFVFYFFLESTYAHPLDIGVMSIHNEASLIHIKLELNPTIGLSILNKSSEDNIDWIVQSEFFFNSTLGQSPLLMAEQPCSWQQAPQLNWRTAEVLELKIQAKCKNINTGPLRMELAFLKQLPPTFNLIIKSQINGQEQLSSADPQQTTLSILIEKPRNSFSNFVKMGFHHIGFQTSQWRTQTGWHLPLGIDHILFLLALVLAGNSFVQLIKMITGFTIGHTIAVALSVFNILEIPGSIVEPIIALTISLVALEIFFKKNISKNGIITLIIGLIHGLAFAEALTNLNLNTQELLTGIAGFNIGVELAQAILIALLFPMIKWLRESQAAFLLKWISLTICIIGLFWFTQRI